MFNPTVVEHNCVSLLISADTTAFPLITQAYTLGVAFEQVSLVAHGNLVLLHSFSKTQPFFYTCMDKTPMWVLTIFHPGYGCNLWCNPPQNADGYDGGTPNLVALENDFSTHRLLGICQV